MQRQRGELVPIGDALSSMNGPVKAKEGMREFALEGRLVYSRNGMPRYKRYLDEMPGVPLQEVINGE